MPPLPHIEFDADFWSIRAVEETTDAYAVRKDVALPFCRRSDRGAMATVHLGAGFGYAATSDMSRAGLVAALERASAWARASARCALIDARTLPTPASRGSYESPSLGATLPSPRAWFELLADESRHAAIDPAIVDWEVGVEVIDATHRFVTSAGGDVVQRYRILLPGIAVTAHASGRTQTRTLYGERGFCQQGSDEVLARCGFIGSTRRLAEEALELTAAPNCPTGRMDVLLMPDQLILQVHESIGHPLELDRILGDERNFAGTSFVTADMFGTYRYGSPLLNVTFDPTRAEELASYGWDDEGTRAERVHLIRDGILERPLGGALSQARAGMRGTANARADGWSRPPIDRMANLNVEPGDASLADMIAGIERGVMMQTNCSWSIDDSRNKFQFGCERGRIIENGSLGGVVRNPNYRGVSAEFWRSLVRVGNADTLEVLGSPHCGKGEPSQMIRVGHAAPACVFADVDVFGGEDNG